MADTAFKQNTCASYVFGRRMRITKVDGCGRPVRGDCNAIVTSGFIEVEVDPEIEDGEEISVKNAAGEVCVSRKGADSLKWLTVRIKMCDVNPALMRLISPSWKPHVDANKNATGVHMSTTIDADAGFALEVWMDTGGDAQVCDDVGAEGAWGYLLIPWISSGMIGNFTVEADALQLEFTGNGRSGGRWGAGPWDVEATGQTQPCPDDPLKTCPVPGKLVTPVDTDECLVITTVTIEPPDASCDCVVVNVTNPPRIVQIAGDLTADPSGLTAKVDGTFVPGRTDITCTQVTVDWGYLDGNNKPVQSTVDVTDGAWTASNKYPDPAPGTKSYTVKAWATCDPSAVSGNATANIPFH